jgi:hypothetical protein
MLAAARERYQGSLEKVTSWDEFIAALNNKHMVLAPWADEVAVSVGAVECLGRAARPHGTWGVSEQQPRGRYGVDTGAFSLILCYKTTHR